MTTKKSLAFWIGAAWLAAAPAAMATVANSSLGVGFSATGQSLWGSGPTMDYHGSGQTPGWLGLWYDYTLSTGSVSADVSGSLVSRYNTDILPGLTNIDLGFLGSPQSSNLESTFGGSAHAGIFVDLVTPWYVPIPNIHIRPELAGVGFSLAPSTQFTAAMGQQVGMSDTQTYSPVSFGIWPVYASLDLGVRQQSNLSLFGVDGLLSYTRRGSGVVHTAPVFIDGDGTQVAVNLDQAGLWDFSFADLTLDNALATGFDLTLGASIDYTLGSWSTPSAAIRLANVPAFALNFGQVDTATAFTIAVVPEPSTYGLFALGLGIVGWMSRRNRTPR